MDILKELQDAGCEIDNHCSDVYTPVTKASTEIVDRYEWKCNVTTFISAIEADHRQWYDIPFAYTPYVYERMRT
jgi:hypothetical protein